MHIYVHDKIRFYSSCFCISDIIIQGFTDTKFSTRITLENCLRVQRRVLWEGENLVQAWLTTFICCFIEYFEGQNCLWLLIFKVLEILEYFVLKSDN